MPFDKKQYKYIDAERIIIDALETGDDIDLSGCELKMLPNILSQVDISTISLVGCNNLLELPEGMIIRDYLDLRGCTQLRALPKNMGTLPRNIDASYCINLTELPGNYEFFDNIWMKGCISVTKLPNRIHCDFLMDFSGCISLVELPDNLGVTGGKIVFDDCISLKELSASGWRLEQGDISMRGCKNLVEISESLEYVDHLNLSMCESLIKLPDNLSVSKLNLTGCSALMTLPESLRAHDIDLSGCTSLTTLPKSLRGNIINTEGCYKLVL